MSDPNASGSAGGNGVVVKVGERDLSEHVRSLEIVRSPVMELPAGVRELLEADLYEVVISKPRFMVWRSAAGVMVEFHRHTTDHGDIISCAVTSDEVGNVAHTTDPTRQWLEDVLP